MPDQPPLMEPKVLHQFKNHLAIIVGYSELLLADIPDSSPHRADIVEILQAARAASELLPELAKHITDKRR